MQRQLTQKQYVSLRNSQYKKREVTNSLESLLRAKGKERNPQLSPVDDAQRIIDEFTAIQEKARDTLKAYSQQLLDEDSFTPTRPFSTFSNNSRASDQIILRFLHYVGWTFRGSFAKNQQSTAYPELTFTIAPVLRDETFMYRITMGIVYGKESTGIVTYRLSLEETLDELVSELKFNGERAFYTRLILDAYKEEADRKGKLSQKRKAEIEKEYRPDALNTIKETLTPDRIFNRLEEVRRSCDISTVDDLIEEWLLPDAKTRYNTALKQERESKRVQNLELQEFLHDVEDVDQEAPTPTAPAMLHTPKPIEPVFVENADVIVDSDEPDHPVAEAVTETVVEPEPEPEALMMENQILEILNDTFDPAVAKTEKINKLNDALDAFLNSDDK